MSKVGELAAMLDGAHVMGEDGLREYHAAKAVINSSRIRDAHKRFLKIKSTLHAYRVTVTWSGAGDVLIRRHDTNQNFVIV